MYIKTNMGRRRISIFLTSFFSSATLSPGVRSLRNSGTSGAFARSFSSSPKSAASRKASSFFPLGNGSGARALALSGAWKGMFRDERRTVDVEEKTRLGSVQHDYILDRQKTQCPARYIPRVSLPCKR